MSFSTILEAIIASLDFEIVTINQTPITVTSLLFFLTAMIGFAVFSRIIIRTIFAKVLSQTKLDEGTQYTFTRIAHYVVLVIGAVVSFQIIGIDLSGLIVVFGFLSVGIGFGLQNLTSNFISGIILLVERPIMVGDRVMVGGTEGDVEEINIRSTTVRTLNNISIIVPNSEFISTQVINWSHMDPKIRLDLDVGVSYDSDLDLVMRSFLEVAEEEKEVLAEPEPEVLFMEFGDSSWNLRLRVWISEPKRHQYVRSNINCKIVRKFRENKIEIPYPQRDLHLRSAVVLKGERVER